LNIIKSLITKYIGLYERTPTPAYQPTEYDPDEEMPDVPPEIQDSAPAMQDSAPGMQHSAPEMKDSAEEMEDEAPETTKMNEL